MRRDDQAIKKWLDERKRQHLYRSTRVVSSPQQPKMVVDGKAVLSFCSNDYLGLANHAKVKKAFSVAADHYGVGAGASHLVNGHYQEHELLEQELAEFTGREAALLFSTGYMANIGVVAALMARTDAVFQDRLNHASLLDAGLLSGARSVRFAHNDMQKLARKLAINTAKNKMLLSDGVFSMDGDVANISRLVELSQQYQAWLMIDDAHGFGVLGEKGAGILDATGASQEDVPLLMATLGKAVGVSGAFVAGNQHVIEFLKQTSRAWTYTTALPPAIAAACRASLVLIQTEAWRREKLFELISLFKRQAKERGIDLLPSDTAIQPVIMGGNESALSLSQDLYAKGIWVTAMRPPSVPENTARLRITLSASHESRDIYQLVNVLEECLENLK